MNQKAEGSETDQEDVAVLDAPGATDDETNSVAADQDNAAEQHDSEEVVVSIGEEAPPPEESEPAPEWVRELRKSHRELQRRNRELEEKVKVTAVEQPPAVGKKPTLEDLDYDAERYEAALSSWYDSKRRADEAAAKAREAAAAQAVSYTHLTLPTNREV